MCGELLRRLEEQRRFADARLAADERHRAEDEAAAENAIESRNVGRNARSVIAFDIRDSDRRATRCRELRGDFFGCVGVPRVAFRTAAEPFCCLRTAFDAGVNGRSFFRHSHDCTV